MSGPSWLTVQIYQLNFDCNSMSKGQSSAQVTRVMQTGNRVVESGSLA